jgi:hypothetical protein
VTFAERLLFHARSLKIQGARRPAVGRSSQSVAFAVQMGSCPCDCLITVCSRSRRFRRNGVCVIADSHIAAVRSRVTQAPAHCRLSVGAKRPTGCGSVRTRFRAGYGLLAAALLIGFPRFSSYFSPTARSARRRAGTAHLSAALIGMLCRSLRARISGDRRKGERAALYTRRLFLLSPHAAFGLYGVSGVGGIPHGKRPFRARAFILCAQSAEKEWRAKLNACPCRTYSCLGPSRFFCQRVHQRKRNAATMPAESRCCRGSSRRAARRC